MQRLLVLNLFISLLWPVLNGEYSLRALLLGFFFGFVLISLVKRSYGLVTWKFARFATYVLYAILESNIRLARTVLANVPRAKPSVQPGIIAIPLEISNTFDITVLASVITLTPGTLSVDLGDQQDMLFVHAMDVNDPDAFRAEIKQKFEAPILELRGLVTALDQDDDQVPDEPTPQAGNAQPETPIRTEPPQIPGESKS